MKKVFIILLPALLLWGCCERDGKTEKVENIIFMIGDGMGLAQLTALSMEQDYEPLNMERARHIGLQKTYSANNRVTDSAASGTAMATGEKTNNGYLGVDALGRPLTSSLVRAQEAGMATGLVVTIEPMAATPAAFYAHHSQRWDYDSIAMDMLRSGVDVIAGSGAPTLRKIRRPYGEVDVIAGFQEAGYTFAPDMESFMAVGHSPAVMFFREDGFPYMAADTAGVRGDYLPQATAKTLELLENSGKAGFFLMVEGSLIDYGGHDNDLEAVLGEMRDFDNAVKVAFDYADSHPGTLVVVTGDHETGGLTIISPEEDFTKGAEDVVYNFSTGDHSGTFIPVYAYGTGAENFTGIMENTDIAVKMKALISR